jgi:head-tail adaptor
MQQELVNTLTTRISIVEMIKTTSASGEPTKAENVVKSCRANQKEVSVDEEEDGKVRALFTTAFIIRYDKALIKGKANGYHIKDVDGYEYNIVSVVPKIDKKYLQINTIRRE